ncbi:MAG: MptD family putative ECF transporter S component [Peptostreptococcaceae bacterium]|nr:MptD family putative ECF transporter S component [Peptostreptococcaceae bacterium]
MNKWKISNFVLIGLLAAIDAAVIYGAGMLTAVMAPVMHVFAPSLTALIMGTVVLFLVKKIQQFGAMTLLVSLGVAIFTLTGMGSSITLLPFVIITSLIADWIIMKTNFKTLSIGIGYGFTQAAYFFGGCFPFIFFLEREIKKWVEMGVSEEEMYGYAKYLTGGFAAIGVISAILFGIIGVYIGKLILKKHLKDMN